MMHGLILAGGDGSRLLASGIATAKALVEIDGRLQVHRLIEGLSHSGCATITCAIREDLADDLARVIENPAIRIVPVREPTSLHTLDAALRTIPDGDVLCAMVDTVMPLSDWDMASRRAAAALGNADAVVVVTPFVEDEKPLWVEVDADGRVRAFGVRGEHALVTGGVYWFRPRARAAATAAVAAGVERMRGFLGSLLERGMTVDAVEVAKIVDVDTSADLLAAIQLLGAT